MDKQSFVDFKKDYLETIENNKKQKSSDGMFQYLMGKYGFNYLPDNKEDISTTIKIMIIGDTGVGKSVICNALFNNNISEYKYLYAPYVIGTTYVSETSSVNSQISLNRKYLIYDTPGLNDNRTDKEEILYKLIYDITKATYIGLDKVIIVVKHNRFSKTINDTFLLIYEVFGKLLYDNLIIIHNYYDNGEPKIIENSVLQQLANSPEIHDDYKKTIKIILSMKPIEIQTTFLIHDNHQIDNFYFEYRNKSIQILKNVINTKSCGLKFEVSDNTFINIVEVIGKGLKLPFSPDRLRAQLKNDIEMNGSKVQNDFEKFTLVALKKLDEVLSKINWSVVVNKLLGLPDFLKIEKSI